MVPRINTTRKVLTPLNYNEQKVRLGSAVCIYARNFIKDLDKLSLVDKLNHFQRFSLLNERAATKGIHISLNFSPAESISIDKLIEIANGYMQRIGFGSQPYLVYKHDDAAHPHIHIVSTKIKPNGKAIMFNHSDFRYLQTAAREIESEFGLLQFNYRENLLTISDHSSLSQKLIYGKSEMKRTISNIVFQVINLYNYTNLEEFNVILKMYNIMADRGTEASRIYALGGLYYRALDDNGKRSGPPIKASDLNFKATLKYLQERFIENFQNRNERLRRIETILDWNLARNILLLPDIINALNKENVNTILVRNKDSLISAVVFVDHRAKVVVDSSLLRIFFKLNHIGYSSRIYDLQSRNESEIQLQRIKNLEYSISYSPPSQFSSLEPKQDLSQIIARQNIDSEPTSIHSLICNLRNSTSF